MKHCFVNCLIAFSFSSVLQAYRWSPTPDNNARVGACAGSNVSFPWSIVPDGKEENIIYIDWLFQAPGKANVSIASYVGGNFFTKANKERFTFTPNAGLHLQGAQKDDAGRYYVRVNLHDPKSRLTSAERMVTLSVEERAPAVQNDAFLVTMSDAIWDDVIEDWTLQLRCGRFVDFGHPPVDVIWTMPSGEVRNSSHEDNGTFVLSVSSPVQGGNYSCHLPPSAPAARCLTATSPQTAAAQLYVDDKDVRLSILELFVHFDKMVRVNSDQSNLLHNQSRFIQDQASLLKDQDSLLQDQDKRLCDHEERLQIQDSLLKNQSHFTQDQASLLKDHDSRLHDQAGLLQNQSRFTQDQASLLKDHDSRLQDQAGLLQNQSRFTQDQASLLKNHDRRLQDQSRSIQDKASRLQYQDKRLGDHEERLQIQDSLLQNQSLFIQDQASLLKDHDSRLQDQAGLLQNQSRLMEDKASRLQDQDKRLGDHEERLQIQDSLLLNQSGVIQDQASLIKDHDTRLQDQDKRLGDHEERLQIQDSLLQNQSHFNQDQASLLKDHDRRLQDQAGLLQNQSRLMENKASRLQDQDKRLGDHEERLQIQDSLLKNQSSFTQDQASLQDEIIDNLKVEIIKLKSQLSELNKNMYAFADYQGTFSSCVDWLAVDPRSGVRTLTVHGEAIRVYCDQATDGGGWTVFQRRQDGSVDFYRGWEAYRSGFGDLQGNFWLGLDQLHNMTSSGDYLLRIDLHKFDGTNGSALYTGFHIAGVDQNFTLHFDSFAGGNAWDSLSYHNKQQFSTHDADHTDSGNCAKRWHGAWWYKSCHYSNLNGRYKDSREKGSDGVTWRHFSFEGFYSLKFSEMKMRPS